MANATDPFERAVQREEKLRARAAVFDSPSALFGFAVWWFAALGVGWAVILGAHWLFLEEPRWLVALHTIVFALAVGYGCVTALFFNVVRKRRPDWFGG